MSETTTSPETGAATGGVRLLLRLEGVVLFAGMTLLYALWDGSWWVYLILFLVPDLSFAAYLAGPKFGALVYNAAHSYLAPVTLMTSGLAGASPLTLSIAMICGERPALAAIGACANHSTCERHCRPMMRIANSLSRSGTDVSQRR